MAEPQLSNIFRKRLLIASRLLALLLIIGIFFIGFVQIHYVKDINELKAKYGANAYCYLCGKESGKSCECIYIPELMMNQEYEDSFIENIALKNAMDCENLNNKNNEILELKD